MSVKIKTLCVMACGLLVSLTGGVSPGVEIAGEMPIIDPNLIGWWNFEEGEGAVAIDSSGHGNHGTLMGDPQWAPGYDGLALDLDGQGDYVETGKLPSELGIGGDAPRTVALWVYTRSFNGGGLYEMGGDSDEEGFSLRTRTGDDEWRLEYGNYGANFSADSLNEWVHFTHVYDGRYAMLYANAVRIVRTWYWLETTDDQTFKIGICRQACLDGLIDDVRLYRRAVTPDEIAFIMQANPSRAWAPRPGHGSTPTLDDAGALHWSAGADAVAHDVYLGIDRDAVGNATTETEGIYRGRLPLEATTYVPPEAPLDWSQSYYWRVDEIRSDGTVSPGGLWRFTTHDYLIIDDFESYDDEDNRIYNTWIDGWDNGTGAIVGYLEAPLFAGPPMPVHGGVQAMPFSYDNTNSPWYSEAFRVWETSQDWTRFGVDTLTLYFIGKPLAFVEREDGTILMGGGGLYRSDAADDFRFAYQQLRGDGSVVVRVGSLAETGPWAQAGVMIRRDLGDVAENAAVTVTADYGIAFQYRRTDAGSTERVTRPGLQTPYWIKLVREGDMLTAWCSANGAEWVGVADDPAASSVEIALDEDVYIGLVVASDVWATPTSAEFSDISLTGDVTGPWEMVEFRVQRRSNDPDPLYVAVADEVGNLAVVNHPDPLAVGAAIWERWDIPLSELAAAGVDVAHITQMTIGVGKRDNPTPSGEGMLHFDDIQLTR